MEALGSVTESTRQSALDSSSTPRARMPQSMSGGASPVEEATEMIRHGTGS